MINEFLIILTFKIHHISDMDNYTFNPKFAINQS